MDLQTELPKLIKYYELKKARCFLHLNHVENEITKINNKIQQWESDELALFSVLKSKKLTGVITLSILYEFQRSEAVIKRKIADIRLQIKAARLKQEKLNAEGNIFKKQLRLCNFKFEKYLFLNKEVGLELLHKQNFLEESIIEELTYVQNR